ncbi:SDR family NAD(P)-dependent oxidoreductase [Aeromicrobium sp. SMF47]|uniref:SDR family NAD(P)-dependent oxidoreductase n=1 Tax=Aeromicrobium yanjiei TaxID=2662028 RepID=A0A5Q2MBT5_9ACTN|nr:MULTISPECIES: SDR family oxidoreductase [Aeromicrobium]MRJ74958.1 SDR family NAD(P)-dependent oxidoreductase [Aeromicrobium yanjiei]MRK02987.1 SDR family NAD(P)-dependent oxidoreductase [Aeromicrobium sp. S22]QGG40547.1 SDR family NAD(P)-dependent oxidoreductase [Aeromicrobium yanjiei]
MTRRALVTGATSGIGNAFARELAKRGHDLVIVARTTDKLEQIAADLRSKHRVEVDVVTADLATSEGMQATANALTDTARPVDLLVNNAGASLAGWFGTTDIVDEDYQLDLLVRAPMHLMDAAIKTMAGRGGGKIINVSSVAAFTPRGVYSAHKAWLLNLSQWADIHYDDVNISVQALCPGFVRTEFHPRGQMDVSDVPRWMWLDADRVVAASLRDLQHDKTVSIPSFRYKVLASLAQHMPKSLVTRIARRGR